MASCCAYRPYFIYHVPLALILYLRSWEQSYSESADANTYPFKILLSFPLDMYPMMGLPDQVIAQYLIC